VGLDIPVALGKGMCGRLRVVLAINAVPGLFHCMKPVPYALSVALRGLRDERWVKFSRDVPVFQPGPVQKEPTVLFESPSR